MGKISRLITKEQALELQAYYASYMYEEAAERGYDSYAASAAKEKFSKFGDKHNLSMLEGRQVSWYVWAMGLNGQELPETLR